MSISECYLCGVPYSVHESIYGINYFCDTMGCSNNIAKKYIFYNIRKYEWGIDYNLAVNINDKEHFNVLKTGDRKTVIYIYNGNKYDVFGAIDKSFNINFDQDIVKQLNDIRLKVEILVMLQ